MNDGNIFVIKSFELGKVRYHVACLNSNLYVRKEGSRWWLYDEHPEDAYESFMLEPSKKLDSIRGVFAVRRLRATRPNDATLDGIIRF